MKHDGLGLTLLLLLILVIIPGMAAAAAWESTIVDQQGTVGDFNSIKCYGGRCSISYYDASNGHLKYAEQNLDLTWWNTTVDSSPGVGKYTSLDFNSEHRPRISYFDQSGKIKYTRWIPEGWQIEVIDAGHFPGIGDAYWPIEGDTSLVSFAPNASAISYIGGTFDTIEPGPPMTGTYLMYGEQNNYGVWWYTNLTDYLGHIGRICSLKLSSISRPHIVYYDTSATALKYIYYTSSGWKTNTITAPDTGRTITDCSLVLNSQDRAQITYVQDNQVLKFIYQTGGDPETGTITWSSPVTVDSGIGYASNLALNPKTGRPEIVYPKVTINSGPPIVLLSNLKLAAQDASGSWVNTTIDSGFFWPIFGNSSLTFDDSGLPRISVIRSYLSGTQLAVYSRKENDGIAIFRPSTGWWYFDKDLNGGIDKQFAFGKNGDQIISGNWQGTGTGIAIFRPSTGWWYFDYNLDGAIDKQFAFGKNGDIPIAGKWQGTNDGIAIFRPSTGWWYFDSNLDGAIDKQFAFGKNGDVPISGNWQGTTDGIAIFRPSTGWWYFDSNLDGAIDKQFAFGKNGDIAIAGNWQGTNDGIAFFRPSTGWWYFDYDLGGSIDKQFAFGKNGDIPISGKWQGTNDGIAIFRASTGWWYFDYDLGGSIDKQFAFGKNGDLITKGAWV